MWPETSPPSGAWSSFILCSMKLCPVFDITGIAPSSLILLMIACETFTSKTICGFVWRVRRSRVSMSSR